MSKTKNFSIDAPEEFAGLTEPSEILKQWMAEAGKTDLRDANAMTLSTVRADGSPTSRVLLCKEIDKDSLYFYSNYDSAKGIELAGNQKVAVNFFWDPLHRQVRIQGTAKKTSAAKSQEYWDSRARASQLSQFVSQQSKPVTSREQMAAELAAAEKRFAGKPVPCPSHWGGYEVRIDYYEFWMGRTNRFHDRITFTKVEDGWVAKRLYP